MEKAPTILVACPACEKQMRMKNPGVAGVYKLTCPACAKAFPVKIVDKTPETQPKPAEEEEGTITQFCSSCGIQLRIRHPLAGQHSIRCPKCQSVQTYSHKPEDQQPQKQEDQQPQQAPDTGGKTTKVTPKGLTLDRGCLVQQRGRLHKNRIFVLGTDTTVGRADKERPSDIAIDNDPSMSRRSIRITAETNPKGFLYKMSVENATNRVLHNQKALRVGEIVYLNFGDTITLGKTTFTFEKFEKKE